MGNYFGGIGRFIALHSSGSLLLTDIEVRKFFGIYLKDVLCPALARGQIVVMDNVSVHKSKRVRELIEQRGCQLWFLPAYSPEYNPIEEAFSKAKGILKKAKARILETLFEATARALGVVGERDAQRFFGHCGYATPQAH